MIQQKKLFEKPLLACVIFVTAASTYVDTERMFVLFTFPYQRTMLFSKVIQDAQVIQDSSYSLQGCMSF